VVRQDINIASHRAVEIVVSKCRARA
jgi:hypothetical protein